MSRLGSAVLVSSVFFAASQLAGCSDSAGVIDSGFEGTYALVAVNGNSNFPVTTYLNEGEQFILLADTLRFTADGKVLRRQIARVVTGSPWPAQDTIVRSVHELEYRIKRRDLEIGYFDPCPDNAMCLGPEVGTIVEPAIWLSEVNFPGNPTLRYTRIR